MSLSKFALILLVCIAATLALKGKKNSKNEVKSVKYYSEDKFKHEWELWKKLYKKEYKNLAEEKEKFSIWLRNVEYVNRHNMKASLGESSFTASLNKYADLSIHDVRKKMNGYRSELKPEWTVNSGEKLDIPKGLMIPSFLDFRDWGVVTGVKDQGECGSCWAFSATGALEAQQCMQVSGNLISLSEQNLVDCSWDYGNYGCEGGLPTSAFQYVEDNGGIDTEASYPYEGENGECRFSNDTIGSTAKGFNTLDNPDEHELMYALAMAGPLSVGIDASHRSFHLYDGGVYDEPACSSTFLDHAVLLVGYGTENGKDYWLVKNSWGTSWGEEGYIKMLRDGTNQCGIATDASYPLVGDYPLPTLVE